jgi:hypothetical protein
MIESHLSIGVIPDDRKQSLVSPRKKRSRHGRNPLGIYHVGLLVNEPPGSARLPFVQSSD